MSGNDIFTLAGQSARWVSARQTVLAENIANANTPNYRARDVKAFSATLDQTGMAMARTNAAHMNLAIGAAGDDTAIVEDVIGSTTHSGNSVSIENELVKLGEGKRDMALGTAVVKSFQRLYLAGLKI